MAKKTSISLFVIGALFVIAIIAIIFLAPKTEFFKMWVDFKNYKMGIESIRNKNVSKIGLDFIDLKKRYVDSEVGIIVDRPYKNWSTFEKLTGIEIHKEIHGELRYELLKTKFPRFINLIEKGNFIWTKHGKKKCITILPDSIIREKKISNKACIKLKEMGADVFYHIDNFAIAVFNKRTLEDWSQKNVWNLFLAFFYGQQGNIENLYYNADNKSILVTSSFKMKNVKMGDEIISCCMEKKVAFFENRNNLYYVDISFLNTGSSSLRIWSELNNYLKSFKIID